MPVTLTTGSRLRFCNLVLEAEGIAVLLGSRYSTIIVDVRLMSRKGARAHSNDD